jgi:simple sugar transport system substrate-binding protein
MRFDTRTRSKFSRVSTPSLTRRALLQGGGAGAALLAAGGFGGVQAVAETLKTAPVHQLLLLSNEWNTIINDAAKRASAVLGLPYDSTVFNLNDAVALTQAQSAAAAGAKLFLINSLDGSALKKIAKTAQDSGGFLINVGSNIPWTSPIDAGPAFTQGFVTREDVGVYETAKYTVGLAVKKFGQNAKFLHVTGPKGAFMDNIRTAAVKRALAEFPGVTILGSLPGNWSAEGGLKATEDLISRYGKPNGIIAQNDGSLTGVLAALRGLKIQAGEEVFTMGVDGATDTLRAIKAGTVAATAFQSPAYHGIQAVSRLYDALNGYEPSAPERLVGFTGLLVTKDNVDGVLRRYVDNKNLPFDPTLLSHVHSGDKWDPQAPLVPIKYEDYYLSAGFSKPENWQPPAAYAKAIESGEFDRVTQRYTEAYKLKLENFDYAGVEA